MANPEHIKQLKQGVDKWNQWRKQNREIRVNLSRANLKGADLSHANLKDAILIKANLRGTDLQSANLGSANLSYTDLSYANLRSADLSRTILIKADLSGANLNMADLSGADLSEADLIAANLSYANLDHANLSRAFLGGTIIANCNLQIIKGLSLIVHHEGSIVEPFSIQLPHDGSALHFLRGAGVPDEWIDYYRASVMHPIQYHSCFISYCSKDEVLARRLHADLQAEGVRCWFAPEDMKIGNKIRERINEAIHMQDKLLLLLSEHTLESAWVETEVETALAKERREKREVLFPVRLDESIMEAAQAWVEHLRIQRHIGDFTKWKNPDAYQMAFTQLLHDLKQS